jgi:serine O-acetyltransferase
MSLYTLRNYRRYDPAAKSMAEILFLYPGIKAMFFYRIGHSLVKIGVPFFPRLVSEIARFITGIDIHPGAQIGRGLIIDHGMGVVIGETAIVGDDVIIYQGVTLGGTSLEPTKRHPTIEDRVVIGAGAKVLGNITIGSGSRLGANSVVIESCPPNSTVVGIPGRIIQRGGVQVGEELSHDLIR